jgi:chromosome segregation protein
MFKALELAGFKSFADKTRFEFPQGITVVVGPNGSGKSNVVDAIKWVLGEQSVKSLRGKEMADVIFNGSGARRGMNTAEVTLTFNNADHALALDTPEVHITRRVYRSGEGEYLINRSPCRLRDIRDLLAGTGMGTQAYSVIEQGKVDILLQSSPRDRRVIFEEAAGISRFKLRKLEALRRLERVDQNLLRLSDIIEEVDARLRTVRAQAGKARRYKEYTGRLQELRTQVGLVDWRRLSQRLAELEKEVQVFAAERDGLAAAAEASEAQLLETDGRIGELNETIRQAEGRIAANRERIAGEESTIQHERSRGRELEEEIARCRRQLATLGARADDLEEEFHDTTQAVRQAEDQQRRIAQGVTEGERALTEVIARLDRLRGEHEQRRTAHLEQMRWAAGLASETSVLESQATAAEAVRQRSRDRIADLDRQLVALAAELDLLRGKRDELARRAEEEEALLAAAKQDLVQSQQELAARQGELGGLQQRHSAAAERATVLEELERRHEGLSAGVKEVLARAGNPASGPFRAVCGMVADLFCVSVEVAPLVDAALGPAAQHIVAVASKELLDFLQGQSQRLGGRVGFVWLDGPSPSAPRAEVDLQGRPGVLGRADRFVETEPRFVPLARRLLGRTWIVEKLSHALELARTAGPGLSFVTLSGELLEADGTLIVGPRQLAGGLISRRSQLRALKSQLSELEGKIAEGRAALAGLQERIAAHEQRLTRGEAEHRQALDAVGEQRLKISAAEERRAQFDQQRDVLEGEFRAAEVQHETSLARLAEARQRRTQLETAVAEMEGRLAGLDEQLVALEGQRQACNRNTTETKVELAKSEERLRSLHARLRQIEDGRQERVRAIAEGKEQLADFLRRAEVSGWNILRAESEIAELYLRKESFAGETVQQVNQRELLQQQRAEATAEAQRLRGKVRKVEERLHAQDLAANEVRVERNALVQRLREDYGIDLAAAQAETVDPQQQHEREAVQEEIDELRRKIDAIGSVNLEALEELETLEARYQTLSGQHQDLAAAKAALEKIIDKINTDSRRLFAETLQTVRGHFQQLFRDLFGGGHGDIVLEEGVDILESGMEIVARPPGKEPRSISLLSGGEKTLTCVALLLAIFRSRPSPFCVLDEVDAALDEANIDRFTKVLRDFLAWTQFIIVTHSKKTMTCADTIYGVTMQESGVSKQVSVRFEDVSEDGQIRPERLAAADEEAEAA